MRSLHDLNVCVYQNLLGQSYNNACSNISNKYAHTSNIIIKCLLKIVVPKIASTL